MELYKDKAQCCGCTACAEICPKKAITMTLDEGGFSYPAVNPKLCVDCGACLKVCPFKNRESGGKCSALSVYAVKHKDYSVRGASSSGGVFYELARQVINSGGSVCGCGFDENFVARHMLANSLDDLNKLKKSKYVESRLDDIFADIKQRLDGGKTVLFSGTGCQVQGLKNFLGKSYENLITVDIICHGVPSPKIFDEYKEYTENKYSSKITGINFRAKKIYAQTQDMEIVFENGRRRVEFPGLDLYGCLYNKNLSIRPSCFNCKFSDTDRAGDITLGDFWGISKAYPEFNDKKGVSLVMINSPKGEKLFNEVAGNFDLIETEINKALQPNLKAPTQKPARYEEFWRDYKNNGAEFVFKKYAYHSKAYKIKSRFKSGVKRVFRM